MNAIEAHELVKEYRTYRKPRHWVTEKLSLGAVKKARVIRALDGISATVSRGASFGIIGPNGSGKTTFLKVITGLVKPTRGRVNVNGAAAAFLELGAGFHPDFTGRRNIYLNCAIMGIGSREIRRKVDEVIEFSELGDAVDDPVRTYSSGMYMRLGFSVAAAMDPQILVVDEVLSVGDEYFMGKCVERLNRFKRDGKTIVMVSHDLGMVRQLCDSVILLDNGRALREGNPSDVADAYLTRVYEEAARRLHKTGGDTGKMEGEGVRRGSGEIEITRVELADENGNPVRVLDTWRPFTVRMDYRVKTPVNKALFGFNVFRSDGVLLASTNHELGKKSAEHPPLIEGASGSVTFKCDGASLLTGDYSLGVSIYSAEGAIPMPVDEILGAIRFKVFSTKYRDKGTVHLPGDWEFKAGDEH